jgi:predicted DNA-binding antitoxin AbrB/MazE fold protein
MAIEVEAVYEGGALRPVRSLPLAEGERFILEIDKIPGQVHRPVVQIAWPPTLPLDYFEKSGGWEDDWAEKP